MIQGRAAMNTRHASMNVAAAVAAGGPSHFVDEDEGGAYLKKITIDSKTHYFCFPPTRLLLAIFQIHLYS